MDISNNTICDYMVINAAVHDSQVFGVSLQIKRLYKLQKVQARYSGN